MKKLEKKDAEPEIVRIKNIIMEVLNKNGFKDVKIILFGSRAKGDFRPHSDWDFLIVVEKELTRDGKWDLAHNIGLALADIYIPADVIVKSKAEVERRKNVIGSVVRNAVKTGVLL